MYTRREFLQLSAAVAAWSAGVAHPTSLMMQPAPAVQLPALYKVLGDQRHPASVAFVEAARAQGLAGHLLPRGDVSRFWLQELQAVWQQAPVAVAGLTDAGPLFCLGQLCGQYGLRVLQREPLATGHDTALVSWLIAPRLF